MAGRATKLPSVLWMWRLPSRSDGVLPSLKTRLARKGYLLEDTMIVPASLFGASAVIVASDPATGRRLRIAELTTPEGPVLRVFFSDPSPEFAQIGS